MGGKTRHGNINVDAHVTTALKRSLLNLGKDAKFSGHSLNLKLFSFLACKGSLKGPRRFLHIILCLIQ